jgi:hypothetical protein
MVQIYRNTLFYSYSIKSAINTEYTVALYNQSKWMFK